MSAILLFLGINKQLDIQTAITTVGRCLAHANGWYGQRRIVQEEFVIALAVFGGASLFLISILLRGALRQSGLAFLGISILCTFVMMRAISFHHLDALLGIKALGVTTNFVFENTGLVLISINALLLLTWHCQPRRHSE